MGREPREISTDTGTMGARLPSSPAKPQRMGSCGTGLPAEAGTVFSSQLSRQRRDNLISIFRPSVAEDIAPDPVPDLPVEHHEFCIDASRHAKPSCCDQVTKVGGQFAENSRCRHC